MKNIKPIITVLMSVHNGEKYLAEAIESILNQTYINFEFLIIDDTSTDSSRQIINMYKELDKRIVLVKNDKNLGLTKSLNIGIRHAKGQYVARMDADDISLPSRLEKQLSFMEQHINAVICGTFYSAESISGKKTIELPETDNEIQVALFFMNCIGHSTVMIRKSFLDKNKLWYNETLKVAQDYELWCRCKSLGYFYNIPEALVVYRVHESSISSKKSDEQILNVFTTSTSLLEDLIGRKLSGKEINIHKFFLGVYDDYTSDYKYLFQWWFVLRNAFVVKSYSSNFSKKWLSIYWYTLNSKIFKYKFFFLLFIFKSFIFFRWNSLIKILWISLICFRERGYLYLGEE